MQNRKICDVNLIGKNRCEKKDIKSVGFCCKKTDNAIIGRAVPQCYRGVGITGPTGPTGPIAKVVARNTMTVNATEKAKVLSSVVGDKTYLDFYIPKGFDGKSETFSIGNVETVESEMNAEVADRITEGVHYLDFKIPKGRKGEIGEAGVGEKIAIDCVTTIDFGEQARVEDNFENNVHNLSFFIPRGAPYINDKTIVSMQKNSNQEITQVNTPVIFESANSFANAFVTETEIEILVAGLYKIDFGAFLDIEDEAQLTLCANGEPIAYSVLNFDIGTYTVTRSLILQLQVNDKISMQASKVINKINFKKDVSFAYINIVPVLN